MSKLDNVVGVQSNDEWNEGFNAGINFVRSVIESGEFNTRLINTLTDNKINQEQFNKAILDVIEGLNL